MHEHICGGDEPVERAPVHRVLQVEDDAALVAMQIEYVSGHAGVPHGLVLAHEVALGRLHLDHVCPHVGEDMRSEGPHHHVGEVDDANAAEGTMAEAALFRCALFRCALTWRDAPRCGHRCRLAFRPSLFCRDPLFHCTGHRYRFQNLCSFQTHLRATGPAIKMSARSWQTAVKALQGLPGRRQHRFRFPSRRGTRSRAESAS